MRGLLDRWKTVYLAAIPVVIGLFALSAVGNTGSDKENAKNSLAWLGGIGFFGMVLTVLALVMFTVALGVRRVRGGAA